MGVTNKYKKHNDTWSFYCLPSYTFTTAFTTTFATACLVWVFTFSIVCHTFCMCRTRSCLRRRSVFVAGGLRLTGSGSGDTLGLWWTAVRSRQTLLLRLIKSCRPEFVACRWSTTLQSPWSPLVVCCPGRGCAVVGTWTTNKRRFDAGSMQSVVLSFGRACFVVALRGKCFPLFLWRLPTSLH
jgi:hypothetical protein